MGRRGPRPLPTEHLKARGSALATKERQSREAKGPAGMPTCPSWLDADAKRMWRSLVPMLRAMRVLTKIDGNALARYCRTWSRWRKAEEFIDKNGEAYPLRDADGKVKYLQQWPQVAIAHKLALQLTRLEQEFGMSPSARSRIQAETPSTIDQSDPAWKYISPHLRVAK